MALYRQLTGKRRTFHMFTQLFVAADHLLLVRSNRFEERYQRFYFKDIQALVVTGLPARAWLQASMGILAGTIFLLALTVVPNPAWRALMGMAGVFPAIILMVDYFRGARCRMILKTAVSNEPLSAVSRMSIAQRVISSLKPAIDQAQQQGEWTPGMAPVTGPPVMVPAPAQAAPANRLLVALFVLVTVNAMVFALARVTKRSELLVPLVYSVATEITLGIAALRRRGGDPRWILYSLSGVTVTCAVLDGLGAIGLGIGSLLYAARAGGTVTGLDFMGQFYPSIYFWWTLGWRAVVAAVAWFSYFIKIEAVPEGPGGTSSPLP